MTHHGDHSAREAGTFEIGGDLPVNRFGFGAMRITGDGIWGEPEDREEAKRVLKNALDLGINFIDTADSYGPEVSENLIHETLSPYPDELVIGTKGGLVRPGPNNWQPDGRPEHLREACEGSLRRLGVERIDLYQFHRPDPDVPFEESVGAIAELREEGKVRHVGLSNVSVEQLRTARGIVPIVSVQNMYNLSNRGSEDVLEACEREGIGFIPYFPMAAGDLAKPGGALDEIASRHEATAGQVALSWLLHHSPVTLPIPGTSSTSHLEENVAAASISLDDEEIKTLEAA